MACHRFCSFTFIRPLSCFQESSRFSLTVSLLFPTSPVICCYYCFYFAFVSFEVANDFYNFEFGIVLLAPSLVPLRWFVVDCLVLVRFRECCCCCTRLLSSGMVLFPKCTAYKFGAHRRSARALALFRLLLYTMQSISFERSDKEIKLVL